MRNSIYRALGASVIAMGAVTAAATPSFASVAGPPPAGGASQSTSVLQGPGGGASQGASVNQGTNPGCMTGSAGATGATGATGPACTNRTSETTRNAINAWNYGGAQLGSAAANLIASAVYGVPSWILDLIQSALHAGS